jgi:type I restriction enzyme M protein
MEFEKGRPKHFLTDQHISRVADVYHSWQTVEGLSASVVAAEVIRNDYNLSPSRYVSVNGNDDTVALQDAVVLLQAAEEERVGADAALTDVLDALGFDPWRKE